LVDFIVTLIVISDMILNWWAE